MNTMSIELTNQRATGILYELEGLSLIKILKRNIKPVKTKLSDKYKGFLTQEEGLETIIFSKCVTNGTIYN